MMLVVSGGDSHLIDIYNCVTPLPEAVGRKSSGVPKKGGRYLSMGIVNVKCGASIEGASIEGHEIWGASISGRGQIWCPECPGTGARLGKRGRQWHFKKCTPLEDMDDDED